MPFSLTCTISGSGDRFLVFEENVGSLSEVRDPCEAEAEGAELLER